MRGTRQVGTHPYGQGHTVGPVPTARDLPPQPGTQLSPRPGTSPRAQRPLRPHSWAPPPASHSPSRGPVCPHSRADSAPCRGTHPRRQEHVRPRGQRPSPRIARGPLRPRAGGPARPHGPGPSAPPQAARGPAAFALPAGPARGAARLPSPGAGRGGLAEPVGGAMRPCRAGPAGWGSAAALVVLAVLVAAVFLLVLRPDGDAALPARTQVGARGPSAARPGSARDRPGFSGLSRGRAGQAGPRTVVPSPW